MTLKELRKLMHDDQLVTLEVSHKEGGRIGHGCFLMRNEPIGYLNENCFCNNFQVLHVGAYDSQVITIDILESWVDVKKFYEGS